MRKLNGSRSLLQGLWTLGIVLLLHPPATSATIQQAKVTQLLDGNQVFIQNRQANVNDLAQRGQRVRTGASRAELMFNTGAVGRLSPNSILTVGQCARLRQGTLLVNGPMNGCTSSVVAGVRGTTYVMEVQESGETQLIVLEGSVVVTRQSQPDEADEVEPGKIEPGKTNAIGDDQPASKSKQFGLPVSAPTPQPQPEPATTEEPPANDLSDTPSTTTVEDPLQHDGETALVQEGQRIAITPTGELGPIARLTAQDFINILQGNLFSGFLNQLPGMSRVNASFQRLFPGVPLPRVNIPVPVPRPRLF